MSCEARQYSDQKYCPRCKLTWDINDPEPPQCGKAEVSKPMSAKAILDKINSTKSEGNTK